MSYVTRHAKSRIKERINIGKSENKLQRVADMAFERGYTHNQTKGMLKKFIDKCFLSYKTGNQIRVYAGYVYIFNSKTLITVIKLPTHLQNNLQDYIRKEG